MKKYSDLELDDIFRKAVREMVEEASPPPVEKSWLEFKKKYKERTGSKISSAPKGSRILKKFLVAAGIVVFLAGAVSFSFPTMAKAIGKKIVSSIETLLTATQMNISTSYESDDGDKVPPAGIQEIEIGKEQIMSQDEVLATAPFPVLFPAYIPESFILDRIEYQELTKNVAKVTLIYSGGNSDNLTIIQMNAPGGFTEGFAYDREDAVTEDILIGREKAKVIVFKNNSAKIMFVSEEVSIEVGGRISKEEALKISASLVSK
mgnify:FL=1